MSQIGYPVHEATHFRIPESPSTPSTHNTLPSNISRTSTVAEPTSDDSTETLRNHRRSIAVHLPKSTSSTTRFGYSPTRASYPSSVQRGEPSNGASQQQAQDSGVTAAQWEDQPQNARQARQDSYLSPLPLEGTSVTSHGVVRHMGLSINQATAETAAAYAPPIYRHRRTTAIHIPSSASSSNWRRHGPVVLPSRFKQPENSDNQRRTSDSVVAPYVPPSASNALPEYQERRVYLAPLPFRSPPRLSRGESSSSSNGVSTQEDQEKTGISRRRRHRSIQIRVPNSVSSDNWRAPKLVIEHSKIKDDMCDAPVPSGDAPYLPVPTAKGKRGEEPSKAPPPQPVLFPRRGKITPLPAEALAFPPRGLVRNLSMPLTNAIKNLTKPSPNEQPERRSTILPATTTNTKNESGVVTPPIKPLPAFQTQRHTRAATSPSFASSLAFVQALNSHPPPPMRENLPFILKAKPALARQPNHNSGASLEITQHQLLQPLGPPIPRSRTATAPISITAAQTSTTSTRRVASALPVFTTNVRQYETDEQISSAQPSAYWSGRFAALNDRFRSEDVERNSLSNQMSEEKRLRKVFIHLESLCLTGEAKGSLKQFETVYMMHHRYWEQSKTGGKDKYKVDKSSLLKRVMGFGKK